MNDKMLSLGQSRSVIREIFEYGKTRKAEIGADKVFDFSLGNPSVPAPECVKSELISLASELDPVMLHGYTSAQGDASVRNSISEYIEKNHNNSGLPISSPDLIYITSGAAAALTCSLTALLNKDDEVIALAPFFPEYRVFTERTGARLITVKCKEGSFRPDYEKLDAALNEKTVAIIINSPNNPTGVVYPEEDIKQLSELLSRKSAKFGHPIYIIADEPYRELVYGGAEVPYIPNFYDNTIVCYSLSKSLSLPGERIGYVSVSPRAENAKNVYLAICGAGRSLGFVCATSLFQFLMARCLGKTSDISAYERNRDILYSALKEYGFAVTRPDGAFYLFVKVPNGDAKAFCEKAKEFELLLVPSDDFGYEGYVRISYCVSENQIKNSLPAFKALADSYK
ncbi:MAG: pyridoxal phosphate-dependent aminotransferase [Ruminococcaceae bacterium]|nr:pyridoxal phosphate-dependent aminotransferase [Oscillospiraceae bacterium]